MRSCPACHTENEDSSRFCVGCGTLLNATCSHCGAELPTGSRFCPACGRPVAAETGEAETLKLATVLFADVIGSTARAEAMHPEDVRDLMASYFSAMSEEIAAQGGTIEKFIGDAIMAVFGVPVAHEDDPVRALRTALAMLERLDRWNADRDESSRLRIRIGINTGQILAAGRPGQDLLVTGDPVNVAARLEEAAEPGTVLVGERTARAVQGVVELRQSPPIEAKGKTGPVPAWLVIGPREQPIEQGVPGIRAPMVGRGYAVELLHTTLARAARDARPHIVTILGDAGVGKSRLTREFVEKHEDTVKVLIGRCLPYGEGVTLWPLGEILKGEAGIYDTDPVGLVLEKILKLLESSLPEDATSDVDRTAAALASTLGLEIEDGPLTGLGPGAVYRQLLSAWRLLLSALASPTSIVAVIEDIHWADPTMLDVLEDLADHVEGGVLFVCTARPDLLRIRPDWGGGRRNHTALPLDPLDEKESALLVSFLLHEEDIPHELKDRILKRAEGNPFFLEEIIRRLIDEDRLALVGERWRATGDVSDVDIPDNVQSVILARLDLLTPTERRIVQQAAVVGRVFWSGALTRLVPDTDIGGALRTLKRREFVVERLSSSIPAETEYLFKHVLIRDVAYESLPRKERGRAHVTVARWIEDIGGERAEEFSELLADHYRRAYELLKDEDLRRSAREFSFTAARRAVGRFAVGKAAALGDQAVELSVPGEERAEAFEKLGDAHNRTFNGDAALGAYLKGLEELERTGGSSDRIARIASKAAIIPTRWHGSVIRDVLPDELHSLIRKGLEAAGEADTKARSRLLAARAFMQQMGYEKPDEEGRQAARTAVEIAERLDDPNLLSATLDALTSLTVEEGLYGEDLEMQRRRLALLPQLASVTEYCDALLMTAWACMHIGNYREGLEHANAAVERARGLEPGSYLHALVWREWALFATGDWDSALDHQAEIERLVAEDPRGLPVGYSRQAYGTALLCRELRGDRDAADAYLELAEKIFASKRMGTRGRPRVALALIRRGELDAAEAFLNIDRPEVAGLLLEARCELVASREDWDAARELLPVARAEAERGGLIALGFYADRLEGRTGAAFSDLDTAVASVRRSAEGFARLPAPWEEAFSRLLLGEILITAGRTPDAADELRAALATFERLGSVQEIARASDLLATLEHK